MPPLRPIPAGIKNLTDQELADQLLKCSYSPGPILPSTRSVYERKLFELQTGEQASPNVSYEPVDDDDDDDNVEMAEEADEDSADDEVVLQQHQPRLRTTKTTRTEGRKTPPRQPVTAKATPTGRPQSARAQKELSSSSKGGLPLWVKLLAILVIAGVVFLVIKNMESDPASEVPDIPDELEINL
ncbi:hypothetical protein ACOMHN_047731 [Nucella lapillus]